MATVIPAGSESLRIDLCPGRDKRRDAYHPELVAIGTLSGRLSSLLSQPQDASICSGHFRPGPYLLLWTKHSWTIG